jgi:hypothetical protein
MKFVHALVPLVSVLALGGCATEEAPPPFAQVSDRIVFHEQAFVTDVAFEQAAILTADSITVAKAAIGDKIASIRVGTVLVGDAANTATNPYGFIRRVTAIVDKGDALEFTTEEASLGDAIEDGHFTIDTDKLDMDLSEWKSIGAELVTQAAQEQQLTLQKNNGMGVSPAFTLNIPPFQLIKDVKGLDLQVSGSITAAPHFKSEFDVHWPCKKVGFWCVNYTPIPDKFIMRNTISTTLTATATASIGAAGLIKNWSAKKALTKEMKLFPVSVFGVPFTVFGSVEALCTADFQRGGNVSVTATGSVSPKIEFGKDGDWYSHTSLTPKASIDAKFEAIAIPSVQARCEVGLKLELKPAGVAPGPWALVGPYVEANTSANCNTRFDAYPGFGVMTGFEKYEVNLKVHKFTIPEWVGPTLDLPFKDATKTFGLSCSACTGHADGYACLAAEKPTPADMKPPSYLLTCKGEKEVDRKPCATTCEAQPDKIQTCN